MQIYSYVYCHYGTSCKFFSLSHSTISFRNWLCTRRCPLYDYQVLYSCIFRIGSPIPQWQFLGRGSSQFTVHGGRSQFIWMGGSKDFFQRFYGTPVCDDRRKAEPADSGVPCISCRPSSIVSRLFVSQYSFWQGIPTFSKAALNSPPFSCRKSSSMAHSIRSVLYARSA
jgi:hypothetical protein